MAETPILPAHIEDTIAAIAKFHADHRLETETLQHLGDRLTALIGRPRFITGLTVVVALWIAGNLLATFTGIKTGDEPPFAWLPQLTLELAILSEQKSAKIIALLEEMRRDSPTLKNRVDDEAAAMALAADPQAVLDASKKARSLRHQPRQVDQQR